MADELEQVARRVVEEATRHGVTVGTAESCTGGLVCGAITDIAGSSAALRGGIVSYDPDVKRNVLGVDVAILEDPDRGVVSSECAAAMSAGARRVLCCDVTVSITGIAGPGGAEPGKPVGTVWFGLATPRSVRTERHLFQGSRSEVRQQAVKVALGLLCEGIAESPGRDS